jgi:hypothetical protein
MTREIDVPAAVEHSPCQKAAKVAQRGPSVRYLPGAGVGYGRADSNACFGPFWRAIALRAARLLPGSLPKSKKSTIPAAGKDQLSY